MDDSAKPDVLMIAASNGENLKLAGRFANQTRELGQSAKVLDLTTIDLPLFTPESPGTGDPRSRCSIATATNGGTSLGDLRS